MRILALALIALLSPRAFAIVGGHEPAGRALDAVGAFAVEWRLGLDPTNPDPATAAHNWWCSATLVTPREIVTARHCVEPYGVRARHAVRFRRRVDGGIGTVEAGVESFFHARIDHFYVLPFGDLAIGYLSEPVLHIAPLPLDFAPVAVESALVLAGWGREGPDVAAGPLRRLNACDTWATTTYPTSIFYPDAWAASPGCGPNSNDSGGALVVGGRLAGTIVSYMWATPMNYYASDPAVAALASGASGEE